MDGLKIITDKYKLTLGSSPVSVPALDRLDLAFLFNDLGFTKGAEIGVRRGTFSEKLCQVIPNLELLCIDPWHVYKTSPRLPSQERQDENYAITKQKLEGYNAELIKKLSMEAVPDVPLASLDFVYIDGHHGYEYVRDDLEEWGKRVKVGGIISGDDYGENAQGVTKAVDEYVSKYNISDWFLTAMHKGKASFFWIKK